MTLPSFIWKLPSKQTQMRLSFLWHSANHSVVAGQMSPVGARCLREKWLASFNWPTLRRLSIEQTVKANGRMHSLLHRKWYVRKVSNRQVAMVTQVNTFFFSILCTECWPILQVVHWFRMTIWLVSSHLDLLIAMTQLHRECTLMLHTFEIGYRRTVYICIEASGCGLIGKRICKHTLKYFVCPPLINTANCNTYLYFCEVLRLNANLGADNN